MKQAGRTFLALSCWLTFIQVSFANFVNPNPASLQHEWKSWRILNVISSMEQLKSNLKWKCLGKRKFSPPSMKQAGRAFLGLPFWLMFAQFLVCQLCGFESYCNPASLQCEWKNWRIINVISLMERIPEPTFDNVCRLDLTRFFSL